MAKYFRRGKSKVYFLPAVAGSSPTSGEMAAGTDLSGSIADIGGFEYSTERIDVPDLGSSFTPQIDGPNTVGEPTLTFNDDDASFTIFNLLPKGTTGFLILAPRGSGAGKLAEKWPIKTTARTNEWSMGNDPARFIVPIAVTSEPVLDGVLP